ncbi:MAG TPA: hypothetical protein VMT27_06530 [Actinomycetes bacterium]|nr:hypothetical protein [Actinomycetes bacterium]
MNRTIRVMALASGVVLLMAGCTDSAPPAAGPDVSSATSPSASAAPTLSARQRASQLAALRPDTFDATYRLDSHGKQPDAKVRMRARHTKFRLDIEQGRTTAVLMTAPRGIVSCQVVVARQKNQRRHRACFLVAHRLPGLPALFDPQVQRLFRKVSGRIASGAKALTVHRAGTWNAGKSLGKAECFKVRGPDVDRGTYCYLAEPGPRIGMLAKATFPSGTLRLQHVDRIFRHDAFMPPVRPTPLPTA